MDYCNGVDEWENVFVGREEVSSGRLDEKENGMQR